jgi:predicted amidohydrolase YtcJ
MKATISGYSLIAPLAVLAAITASAGAPSAAPAAAAPAPATVTADEVRDIDWRTSPLDLNLRGFNGGRFRFHCPPGKAAPGLVIGTRLYADNSAICAAAMHAGVLRPSLGGFVNIEICPGSSSYRGSDRHFVASGAYEGPWGGSFIVQRVATDSCPAANEMPPDLVLFNGKVFTSDADHPYVQALAIRGTRIIAMGDSDKIKALGAASTRSIDVGGRTVIPGINDAHDHIEIHPSNLVEVQFQAENPNAGDLRKELTDAAAKAPKGALLEATISPGIFYDTTVNRDFLDALLPNNPVILITITGHGMILNTAGLRAYGVAEQQKDPLGGRFERDAAGRLTGVVREYAGLDMERTAADAVPDSEAVRQLRDTLDEAKAFGITTIQDMSNDMTPARAVALLEKVPTPIRLRVMRMPGTRVGSRNIDEGVGVPRHPNPLISVSGTKWMIDGVPIEGTFTPRDSVFLPPAPPFDQAFHDLPLTFPESEIAAMLRESVANDDQLLVHVSGYLAAKAMLDAMDASGGPAFWRARRVRFEHGDGIFPDLYDRVKAYGIVVVQNPSHFMGLGRPGRPAFEVSQPAKSLLSAGIPMALGSDGPTNPYLNILFATIHANHPSEAITREQAVVAYTLTSAYAEFAEKEKGSLSVGKLADIAVLSQDIFTVPAQELPKTRAVLTVVGGKIVFKLRRAPAVARIQDSGNTTDRVQR